MGGKHLWGVISRILWYDRSLSDRRSSTKSEGFVTRLPKVAQKRSIFFFRSQTTTYRCPLLLKIAPIERYDKSASKLYQNLFFKNFSRWNFFWPIFFFRKNVRFFVRGKFSKKYVFSKKKFSVKNFFILKKFSKKKLSTVSMRKLIISRLQLFSGRFESCERL